MRRSAAAGVGPRAGESWQSQQQPGKAAGEEERKMNADENRKTAGGVNKTDQFKDARVAIFTESNLKRLELKKIPKSFRLKLLPGDCVEPGSL